MIYADYEYYTDVFFGEIIPSDKYNAAAKKASDYLRYIALNNISADNIPDAVKDACCAMAEKIYTSKSAISNDGTEIASESVGSWSASYRSAEEVREARENELYNIAQKYLAHTGLLYRGGKSKCILPTL